MHTSFQAVMHIVDDRRDFRRRRGRVPSAASSGPDDSFGPRRNGNVSLQGRRRGQGAMADSRARHFRSGSDRRVLAFAIVNALVYAHELGVFVLGPDSVDAVPIAVQFA
jgi:hypothetical protein